MKQFFPILISLILISCKQNVNLNHYISKLPDSAMVNDLFIQVAKMDSFRSDYSISKKIYFPRVVKGQKSDSMIAPPPPNAITYDDMFEFFGHDSIVQKRYDDSIFINLQLDTLRRIEVSKSLVDSFSENTKFYYEFNIPIFSYDKKFVVVKYWLNCGYLCGSCRKILFKRENSKWVEVDRWICGIK